MFVCELANRGSVVDYLQSWPPENRRTWKYLRHAALGLAYLHESGIIHGDLRGSNILLGDDGQAKLANFGLSGSSISKHGREATKTSRGFVGSMRWQSPELLQGRKPTYASDMYALGLCHVEMWTGNIPWHDQDNQDAEWSKLMWKPETYDDRFREPAELVGECRRLVKQLCFQEPALRLTASACVRLIESIVTEEDDDSQTGAIQPQMANVNVVHYWQDELTKQWMAIQELLKEGAANDSYSIQSVVKGLEQIYDAIQISVQPPRAVQELCMLVKDSIGLIQNASQAALVVQLSSTRATTSNIHALRRRITALKSQFHIHDDQHQEAQYLDEASHRVPATQMFVSEISKTWLILDELKTREERAALLSLLYAEIHQDSANYSVDQREIIEQAYDDLKSTFDVNDEFTTNLPVWFISWFELSRTHGEEIGTGGFGSVYLAK